MGNCQAAEAAAVVIQHSGSNKVERIYCSVNAHEVMNSNPGHYVAMVVTPPATAKTSENGTPVRQMKLLRPDDTLLIGHVYRLISFEDVLKEFATKKCVKLGRLLKDRGTMNSSNAHSSYKSKSANGGSTSIKAEENETQTYEGSGSRGVGRLHSGGRQWRPALHSIAEIGT